MVLWILLIFNVAGIGVIEEEKYKALQTARTMHALVLDVETIKCIAGIQPEQLQ